MVWVVNLTLLIIFQLIAPINNYKSWLITNNNNNNKWTIRINHYKIEWYFLQMDCINKLLLAIDWKGKNIH